MNKWSEGKQSTQLYEELARLDVRITELRHAHSHLMSLARRQLDKNGKLPEAIIKDISGIEYRGRLLREERELLAAHMAYIDSLTVNKAASPPRLGERILLLILTKEERVNIPGDLEEEYRGIAAKHGAWYAKLWYYKQVAASAWPMLSKAVRWGLLASIGAWIRRII